MICVCEIGDGVSRKKSFSSKIHWSKIPVYYCEYVHFITRTSGFDPQQNVYKLYNIYYYACHDFVVVGTVELAAWCY